MIPSIIGALLSFISVLQNINKKKTLEDKVIVLRSACNELDLIYNLLSESKSVHNEFQKFENAALQNLKNAIEKKNSCTQKELDDEIKLFIVLSDQLLRTRKLTYNELSIPENNGSSLPVEIVKNGVEVSRKYPIIVDNLNTFNINFVQLNALLKTHNYGNELDEIVLKLEHSTKGILNFADDVILNTAPILDFIHYRIKETLNQIV
jgi:hypothetical protein